MDACLSPHFSVLQLAPVSTVSFLKKSDKTGLMMDGILHSIAPGKKNSKAKGKRKQRAKVRNTLCFLERNRSFLLKTGRWDRVSGNQQ